MIQTELKITRESTNQSFMTSYSGSNCTQTITPILAGKLQRTINGKLIYLGTTTHHKYRTSIMGKDKSPLALDGVWKGEVVKVDFIQRLSQGIPSHYKRVTLYRSPVEKSVQLFGKEGKRMEALSIAGSIIDLPLNFSGGFVSYRPQMTMMVKDYSLETNEWGHAVGWRLDLEEI